MQDGIHWAWNMDVIGDVLFYKQKPILPKKVLDIFKFPGKQVVDTNDLVAVIKKTVTKVRSNEPCATSNNNSHDVPPIQKTSQGSSFEAPGLRPGNCGTTKQRCKGWGGELAPARTPTDM